jgi:hypothetical protein
MGDRHRDYIHPIGVDRRQFLAQFPDRFALVGRGANPIGDAARSEPVDVRFVARSSACGTSADEQQCFGCPCRSVNQTWFVYCNSA